MSNLKKWANVLAPVVNSLWYNVALIVVMLSQLMIRRQSLIILAMLMIFVFFGVQLLTQDLTKRQRILYSLILGLNAATVLMLAWATTFGAV
ncbi:hypothetical protein ACRHK7_01710 [Weissella tructae]|uniref:Uncharacterized protein n=2 Tax=Weissella TaxID=46255 RepID=A0A075U157_9LACO|nr:MULTISPECIES: hypothetical protein [Weissella]AIG65888.1 hypothetical protein WS08_0949 [Weissella tructae]AIM63267.1 hypothetical protein WS74_1015 [Weissella ceti]AIM64601.1 hypothetical protein WS105_1011 [Weissella ceti]ELA07259.1 hypothetical protein WCNC_02342 [Weissella ceti NC36]QVV91047.1 hypothetical protein KHQ32_05320 [Weissella tructae]